MACVTNILKQKYCSTSKTLVPENKCKQQHFHNIQAGWDCSEGGVCAVHPAERILMRFFCGFQHHVSRMWDLCRRTRKIKISLH